MKCSSRKYQNIINSIYCNCHTLNVTTKDSIKNESTIIRFIRILTSQNIRNEYDKYINLKKLDVTKIPTWSNTWWCFLCKTILYVINNKKTIYEFMR